MIGPRSRYANIEVASFLTTRNGQPAEIRYLRRRFTPSPEGNVTVVKIFVKQGDRLDNIAARFLGDPTLFWQLCDANGVLRPEELTETLGRSIDIVAPLGGGRT